MWNCACRITCLFVSHIMHAMFVNRKRVKTSGRMILTRDLHPENTNEENKGIESLR